MTRPAILLGLLFASCLPALADYCPPASPQSSGMRDIMLAYMGKDTWNQQDFEPYVAWLDKSRDGEPRDWFYDSWLFLMFGGAPSGGTYAFGTATKSDWDFYLDLLFAPQQHLAALNASMADMGQKLGDPDRTCPVMIMIPYIDRAFEGFGDVDGDGVDEDFENQADCTKAYKWFVDAFLARWKPADYPHLKLWGFYWMMEGINPSEDPMVREMADYCHARSAGFHWIPWYAAPGYDRWRELGFDFIVMQPNFAFMPIPRGAVVNDEGRLTENAVLCRRNGLGYEMEADYQPVVDPGQRLELQLYLNHGVDELDGYMNGSVRAYYQSQDTIAQLYRSTIPECNRLYDDLYRFHKGTYMRRPVSLCEGAPATLAGAPAPTLTDGVWITQGSRHRDRLLIGAAPLTAEVDLGAAQIVGDVRVHLVTDGPDKLRTPGSVTVSTSADGVTFEECTSVACPALFEDEGWRAGFAMLTLPPRPARKLRVVLNSEENAAVALDEIVIMPAAHLLWGLPYELTGALSPATRIETGNELTDGRLMRDTASPGGIQFADGSGAASFRFDTLWALEGVLVHARWPAGAEAPRCRLAGGQWVQASGAGEAWIELPVAQRLASAIDVEFSGPATAWWDEVRARPAPNLAASKPYSLRPAFPANYPDTDDRELTDGVLTEEGFGDGRTIGWGGTDATLTVDLGREASVDRVRLHLEGGGSAGVNYPRAIDIWVSTDGTAWRRMETGEPAKEVAVTRGVAGDAMELAWLTFSFKPTPARFARAILSGPSYWLMASEMQVLTAEGGANLALNQPYHLSPLPKSEQKYADNGSRLTDGGAARPGDWSRIAGWPEGSPEIIVDLLSPATVNLVRAHCLGGGSGGVYFPTSMSVATSLDGQSWSEETVTTEVPPEPGRDDLASFVSADLTPREARYLRLRFERPGWLFLSEIEAYGP